MLTLQERLKPLRTLPHPSINLSAWLAAWPSVREEFEALSKEHKRCYPGFHPQWTMSALESVDVSLRDLAHRVAWLEGRLAALEDDRCRVVGG